jgi:hypothetical protein
MVPSFIAPAMIGDAVLSRAAWIFALASIVPDPSARA